MELIALKFCAGSLLIRYAIRVRQPVSRGLALDLFSMSLISAIEVLCKLLVQGFAPTPLSCCNGCDM